MNKHFFSVEYSNNQINKNAKKFIKDVERDFVNQFDILSQMIVENNSKIVLVTGPSCAGKTTYAKLLKLRLERQGYHIVRIEMDNFFIDRAKRRRLENGEEDMDSLNIVNLQQLKNCFSELFEKGLANFPIYDFTDCKNIPNQIKIEMKHDTIIIFEGIHVLNPKLIKYLPTDKIFKVYISNFNGFEFGGESLSTRELRLVRRMVRDSSRRNTSPRETLNTWRGVCESEDKYIVPFKTNANFEIDTTHYYELGLYKEPIEKLIQEDGALLTDLPFLKIVLKSDVVNKKLLPPTTIMWEFIDK